MTMQLEQPAAIAAGVRIDIHVCPEDKLEDKISRLLGWKIDPIVVR